MGRVFVRLIVSYGFGRLLGLREVGYSSSSRAFES